MSGTRLVLAAAPDHVIPIFGNRTPSCEDVLIGNRLVSYTAEAFYILGRNVTPRACFHDIGEPFEIDAQLDRHLQGLGRNQRIRNSNDIVDDLDGLSGT